MQFRPHSAPRVPFPTALPSGPEPHIMHSPQNTLCRSELQFCTLELTTPPKAHSARCTHRTLRGALKRIALPESVPPGQVQAASKASHPAPSATAPLSNQPFTHVQRVRLGQRCDRVHCTACALRCSALSALARLVQGECTANFRTPNRVKTPALRTASKRLHSALRQDARTVHRVKPSALRTADWTPRS